EQNASPTKLSHLVSSLRDLAKQVPNATRMDQQIVEHLLEKVEAQLTELEAFHASYNSQISFNKILVEKMLESHRASRLFWQEVVAEVEAVYTKGGIKKAEGNGSVLKVQV